MVFLSGNDTVITLPSGKTVRIESHPSGDSFNDLFDKVDAAAKANPTAQSSGDSFDQLFDQVDAAAKAPGTPDEQKFLQSNPDYTYVPKDPSRPNTQEGIYKKSEAATMAKDPTMEHHPVDLDFAKHTAEYGAGSAAAIGGLAAGAPAIGAAAEGAVNKVLDPNAWRAAGKTIVNATKMAAGSYALSRAKELPVVGPILQKIPNVEMLPWFMGGSKSKGAAEEEEATASKGSRGGTEGGNTTESATMDNKKEPGSGVGNIEDAEGRPTNDAGKFTKPKPNPPDVRGFTTVQSGNVDAIKYDADKSKLYIRYKSGDVYSYDGVPQKIVDAAHEADSTGSYVARNIKGRYGTKYQGNVLGKPGVGASKNVRAQRQSSALGQTIPLSNLLGDNQ